MYEKEQASKVGAENKKREEPCLRLCKQHALNHYSKSKLAFAKKKKFF